MKKLKVFLISVICLLGISVPVSASTLLSTDVETASVGNVLLGMPGSYYTQAEEALARINEIRLEACREGVENPSTGRALTEADYVPIKWSSDLEYIARIRAAESTLTMAHIRTNGNSIWTLLSPNGAQSWGEVLAWNYSTQMVHGINQWYEEKSDWVNKTGGVTGHYTQMIDPQNTYVGLGLFSLEGGSRWNTTAGEFSSAWSLDETMREAETDIVQILEFPSSDVSYALSGNNTMTMGESQTIKLCASAMGASNLLSLETLTWSSSDPAVAAVDVNGTVQALGKGDTTINAVTASGQSYALSVHVKLPAPVKGQTYTVDNLNYKVTAAGTDGSGKVTVTGSTLGSTELKKLVIPDTVVINDVTMKVTAVGAGAFRGYTALTTVSVGNQVSVIGAEAFASCTALKKAALGTELTKISAKAFYNCKKLYQITIKSEKLKTVGSNAIAGCNKKLKLKVPSAKVSTYKRKFSKKTGFTSKMRIRSI